MKTTDVIQAGEIVNKVMNFKEWVLIFILSIIWGGSFFFVGVAVKELPPLKIVVCRVALASVVLLAALYFKGEKMPVFLRVWGAFIVMGALNNLIPFSVLSLPTFLPGKKY